MKLVFIVVKSFSCMPPHHCECDLFLTLSQSHLTIINLNISLLKITTLRTLEFSYNHSGYTQSFAQKHNLDQNILEKEDTHILFHCLHSVCPRSSAMSLTAVFIFYMKPLLAVNTVPSTLSSILLQIFTLNASEQDGILYAGIGESCILMRTDTI